MRRRCGQMLERDTGIRSMTIARFLVQWGRLLHEPGNASLLGEARSALGDHVLVLDEASMVPMPSMRIWRRD
ncbi:AAA family ATPase [Qipengyuania flava]|uniref:AAA family ATPase n=1 Tax=Qipengyuania flava TaxID=192812 RepID=UPI0039F4E7D1